MRKACCAQRQQPSVSEEVYSCADPNLIISLQRLTAMKKRMEAAGGLHAPCLFLVPRICLSASCAYGIAGLGTGETPQIAVAQAGSCGVGMSTSFPWVAAVPPFMQAPVKVLMSGNGVVKPSVRVWRKATIWFSSVSVR